jgi:hypothetical protein
MLLSVFREHNKKYRELVGKDYVLATVLRYERTVTYLSEFLKLNYQLTDIPLKNIDNAFIVNFEHFVKTRKNCAQNATVKYMKNLKKVIQFVLGNNPKTNHNLKINNPLIYNHLHLFVDNFSIVTYCFLRIFCVILYRICTTMVQVWKVNPKLCSNFTSIYTNLQ